VEVVLLALAAILFLRLAGDRPIGCPKCGAPEVAETGWVACPECHWIWWREL